MKKSRPVIGLLAGPKWEWMFCAGMIPAARIVVINPEDNGAGFTSKLVVGRRLRPTQVKPAVVYNRSYWTKLSTIQALEGLIGCGRVFNRVVRVDKQVAHQLLSRGFCDYLPRTEPYSVAALTDMLSAGDGVVLKPAFGRFGSGVYRVDMVEGRYALYHKTIYPLAEFPQIADLEQRLVVLMKGKRYLVQQFIPFAECDGRLFDIRLLVQKNGTGRWVVSADMSRLALKYSYLTNVCVAVEPGQKVLQQSGLYTQALWHRLQHISIAVAECLEQKLGCLGEISVDFGIDCHGKPWIIEVNGMPAKGLFAKLVDSHTYKSLFRNPLEYGVWIAKQSS